MPRRGGPVAPGSSRSGAVRRVTFGGAGLSAHFGIVTDLRIRGVRRSVLLELRLKRPACAGRRDVRHRIGGIWDRRRRTWSQMLIVSPSTGDFDRARWCAGDYSGEVVADRRTIGTFSFRVTL